MRKTLIPALLVTLSAASACSQDDLGRYCFVGAEGDDVTLTILNTEAPECGERLCLKQGGYHCTDGTPSCLEGDLRAKLQPMCTQECKANKDCQKTPDNVNACTKYVCQEQGAETGFGDHCICVCLDFLRDEGGLPITEDVFNTSTNDYSPCSPK